MIDSTALAAAVSHMITTGTDGTLSVDGSELPTRGYYVGGMRPSLVNPSKIEDVAWFIDGTEGIEFVGVWTDTDGTVYVDASEWTPSQGEALARARERGEIAVWDIARCREIRTDVVNRGAW